MSIELVPVAANIGSGTTNSGYVGTLGYEFTPKAGWKINSFGALTLPSQTSWGAPVQVAIYRVSDQVAVFSGSLPADRAGCSQSGAMVYKDFDTPLDLPIALYRVAALYQPGDGFALGLENQSGESADADFGTAYQNHNATTISFPDIVQVNYPSDTHYPYMGPGLKYTLASGGGTTPIEAIPCPATSVPASTITATYDGAFGFRFMPTTNISITDLGAFVSNGQTWTNPVPIKIFKESDQSVVASAVLPANREGMTSVGSMAYQAQSTPPQLQAGTVYRIAMDMTAPDCFALGFSGPVDTTGNITFYTPGGVQNHNPNSGGLAYPGETATGSDASKAPYLGPSFRYTVLGGSPPAALTFGALSRAAGTPSAGPTISWLAATGGSGSGYSYALYRSLANIITTAGTTLVGTTSGTSLADPGAPPGVPVFYRTLVTDSAGTTAWSMQDTNTTSLINSRLRGQVKFGWGGHSIVAGQGASNAGVTGAVAVCMAMLAKALTDYGVSASDYLNTAVSGTTAADWVASLASSSAANFASNGVTHVPIMLGTNEPANGTVVTPAQFRANMAIVINEFTSRGMKVILLPCSWVAFSGRFDDNANSAILSYNAVLPSLANGVNVFHTPDEIFNYFYLHQSELPDGIHPGDTGCISLAQMWEPEIVRAITGGGSGSNGINGSPILAMA